jgi:2-polyprenyl-3-methyl-5-hydroxy-6-metoxy-1,4-benzoquinol methylase
MTTIQQGYTLDNAWAQARERLGFLEAAHNPGSIRHLERLGVGEGWRCLEVGAGGGSIAEWLCQRAGATGYVLATDIDTRFLDVLRYPNLDVCRHDVIREALPEATFDLVHCRALLVHLAEREVALRNMVSALKPGGWLLVEEPDWASSAPDPRTSGAALYAKAEAAILQLMGMAGFDRDYGRRLYRDVCLAGLVDVDAEGRVEMLRANIPYARFSQLTFAHLRDRIVGVGLLTDEEVDGLIALLDDKDLAWLGATWMAVWGRKPASA